MTHTTEKWLEDIRWNEEGLIPAVVQDEKSGRLLMLAWMNRYALRLTAETGRAVYWSRSRHKLWNKGEQSGYFQFVKELRLDCDNDAVLLSVEQVGDIACHTGRRSCFFRKLEDGHWLTMDSPVRDPDEIYR
ncbi:MAG: Phosphoribosyl-AMP cyclohydrolase [Gammaproteobacteria bacterium]|nr:Phosphoribosyl-AMP cyclohydrolase [Gammaproteobacteria bacterium]